MHSCDEACSKGLTCWARAMAAASGCSSSDASQPRRCAVHTSSMRRRVRRLASTASSVSTLEGVSRPSVRCGEPPFPRACDGGGVSAGQMSSGLSEA